MPVTRLTPLRKARLTMSDLRSDVLLRCFIMFYWLRYFICVPFYWPSLLNHLSNCLHFYVSCGIGVTQKANFCSMHLLWIIKFFYICSLKRWVNFQRRFETEMSDKKSTSDPAKRVSASTPSSLDDSKERKYPKTSVAGGSCQSLTCKVFTAHESLGHGRSVYELPLCT